MPRYNHLHDLSAREAFGFLAYTLDNLVRDALHSDEFFASEN
jgi:hypothetical protein